MEFPPEIVDIISQYSRPCFKYFLEYERVMRLSGIVKWPLLKTVLAKDHSVLPFMLAYENALIECSVCEIQDHPAKRKARTKALNELVVKLIL